MVASRRFATLVRELADRGFDYVLVDSPAFLAVGDAAALAGVVDAIVLLVNMKMINKPTLEEARDFLGRCPRPSSAWSPSWTASARASATTTTRTAA